MTGPLNAIEIRGADGGLLRDKWADGPRAYLGIASAGFPNLFMLTAPGSPSVLVNMIVQHVDWVADLVEYARARHRPRRGAGPRGGPVGRARQRARGRHLVPEGSILVHGRQCAG